MLCSRHYFTFPQHLHQGLGTQACLKQTQPSCESAAPPSADRWELKESLKLWPCLQRTSRCYSWGPIETHKERTAKEERGGQPLSFLNFVFTPTNI